MLSISDIDVSVCIFSFNYEKYISSAIESVLKQKVGFPIEVLIFDDCSTDSTASIALQFQQDYPDLIKVYINDKNIGGTANWVNAINRCSGKYIALLDGDDYFTDSSKLNLQYEAMEKDPTLALCFHSVEEKYDDVPGNDFCVEFPKSIYTIEDFMRNGWFVRTSSTFFRKSFAPVSPPDWVYDFPYRYDTILHVFLCQHGNALNIKRSMSVWRKQRKGISYFLMTDSISNSLKKIELSRKLDVFTNKVYKKYSKYFISSEYTFLFVNLVKSISFFKFPFLFIKSLFRINYFLLLQILRKKFYAC